MELSDFKKFELGIESIDAQHRQLLSILEDVYELIRIKSTTDKYDEIFNVIGRLKQYTVEHFSYEENLMSQLNYPKFSSHKLKHIEFIESIEVLDLETVDEDQTSTLINLLDFISKWITEHINSEDRRFALYFMINS